MKAFYSLIDLLAYTESLKETLLKLEAYCITHVDDKLIQRLASKDEWVVAERRLKDLLVDDQDGLQMLCCMMIAALETYEQYEIRGIPEKIFIDTMNCFPRFVREYEMMYGSEGFDRSFWTGRQLSLSLFRIQELEFELCEDEEGSTISIHIPSDAKLQKEQCITSILQAKQFFQTYHLCDCDVPMVCESWLLSPALKTLLPSDANIIQFQSLFDIQSWDQEAKDYLMWVYHCEDQHPMELSEDTSLQRSMKQHILHDDTIGNAKGTLKPLDKV